MKRLVVPLWLLLCLSLCCCTGCGLTAPTAGWQVVDGQRCYLDATGQPLQGWQVLDGKTYCFREDGTPMTGWVPCEEGRRFFDPDGIMLVGRQVVQGEVRFFAPNGLEVLLVNARTPLPSDYTVELRDIGGGRQIAAVCYDDLQQMLSDCRAAGCEPAVCSAYRSWEKQEKLFRRKVAYYRRQGYTDADAVTLAGTVVAAPGTSEHQLGMALDIVDSNHWDLDESQEDTPAQQWLMAHSWEYGFVLRYPSDKSQITGVIYEPWHYRWVGRAMAAEIHEQGLCLEEYLGAAETSA